MTDTGISTSIHSDTKLAPMYRVLLHNDDINTFSHVIRSLQQVFKMDSTEAEALAFEADRNGVAQCGVFPKEHSEFFQEQLQALSLTSTIEPE